MPAEFNPKYTRPLGGMVGRLVRPTGPSEFEQKTKDPADLKGHLRADLS